MILLQNLITIPTDSIAVESHAEEWALLKSLPLDELIDQLLQKLIHFGFQLAVAILVFVIGRFLIKRIHVLFARMLRRRHVDESLTTFLLSMAQIVMFFILIVMVIGILGIETSSFIALFASAGVAVGMALSGTLQNFAGGVLILLLKPYRVGDYIEAQGYAGTVREIQIFSTIITTYDNKGIIIPNGPLSTSSINNWSREQYRRVDWSVAISYGDDFDNAKSALLDILNTEEHVVKHNITEDRHLRMSRGELENESDSDQTAEAAADEKQSLWRRLFGKHHRKVQARIEERIHNMRLQELAKVNETRRDEHAPSVVIDELADSSVNLTARAWVPTANYWSVFYHVNERIYTELPKRGVNFPFPQMDVHLNYTNTTGTTPSA